MNVFDAFEKPFVETFHFIHSLAKLKAARLDEQYGDIERRRHEGGSLVTFISDTLSLDDWEYQDAKIYELTPSLHFWHALQLKARQPRHWWSEAKAAKMRAVKGYDPMAIWSFWSWHAAIVAKVLTEYRKVMHGHPANMSEEQWKMVVDNMIEAFEAIVDADRDSEDEVVIQARVEWAFKLLTTYYQYLWD